MKKYRFHIAVLILAAVALYVAGCGGGGDRGVALNSPSTEVAKVQQAIQAAGADWTAAENPISQLADSDFEQLNGLILEATGTARVAMRNALQSSQLPSSIDWRDKDGFNWLTSIKNQGTCGSCVAFSSLGVVESLAKIANGNPSLDINLSEAELFSCGGGSCASGWYKSAAADKLKYEGTVDEACLPYEGVDNVCSGKCSDWQSRLTSIDSWAWVPIDVTSIKNYLQQGPVLSGIAVYEDFKYYSSGVYEHVYGSLRGYHAVAIVGYDDDGQYWIVRNSWSSDWGEQGYFRVRYGEIGIEDSVIAMRMTGNPAGVVASVDLSSVSLSGGQAQVTLTCSTNGSVTTLQGRCDTSDSWTTISSGSTQSCIYTSAGTYTPGCQVNGTATDNVDTPVTVLSEGACGNGSVDTGEDCDDGNTTTEACSYGETSCTVCNSTCQSVAGSTSYCGDGSTDSTNGEGCDDGNTTTETCSYGQTSCTVCTSSCQEASGATSYCGDTVVDSGNSEQCDDGNTSDGDGCSSTCQTETPPTEASAVASGKSHTCALLTDGTVQCWGSGSSGRLGNGDTASQFTPVEVTGITDATQIAAGGAHTCVMLSGGTVKCWGFNMAGELGDGTTTDSSVPVTVTGLSNVQALSAGDLHTCALINGGTVKCWGHNVYGQLGDGTTTNSSTAVAVSGLSGVTAISAGVSHTCALLSDETMKCWGYNEYGKLGDGTTNDSPTPIAVAGLTGIIGISTGESHTCAVLSTGYVKCWGMNMVGQLGDGTTTNHATPTTVESMINVASVSSGAHHNCVVHTEGTVRCWGSNSYGQLGDGTTTNRTTAVYVSGLDPASSISAGESHVCALMADSSLMCWGLNSSGQLGDGTTTAGLTPVTVSGF